MPKVIDRPTCELHRRLRLLNDSITRTKARPLENLWLAKEHVDAYMEVIEGLAKDAGASIARLEAARGYDAVDEARGEAQQAVLRVERAWSLFGLIRSQHQDTTLGPWLQVADRCAMDGYETLRQRCEAIGAVSSEQPLPPPPITFADAIMSPVVHQQGARVRSSGLVASEVLELPLPVVVYPPSQLACLWLYTTLHHEVGHNFERALGISADVEAVLESAAGLGERLGIWRSWAREMIADAVGVGLGGEGFALALADVLQGLSLRGWFLLGKHPPPVVRLHLAAGLLDALVADRVNEEAGWIRGTSRELRELADSAVPHLPDDAAARSYLHDTPAVAAALLSSALPSLGSHRLRDVFPDVGADAVLVRRMVAILQKDASTIRSAVPMLDPPAPWRLLPAAAQLGLHALPRVAQADLDAIQEKGDVFRGAMEAPGWVVSPTRWRTLRKLIPQIDRSIYEAEESGHKKPPLELLRQHDRVAFVGATNDQLAGMLERAYAPRARPWTRINVYFLVDSELGPLARGEKTAVASLQEAKRDAIAALNVLLPKVADTWNMYEYERAHYFASYWDHDVVGGRIHVSPFIWNTAVKLCPGLDYLWHRDQSEPTREYQAYADGLDGLSAEPGTRRIAGSH